MCEIVLERSYSFASPEYWELFEDFGASAFQHPIWLDALYRLAPAAHSTPAVVTIREEGGRLAAVLPLLAHRRGPLKLIEFADLGVSDYAAPVGAPATLQALAANEAVGRKIRALLQPCDLIRIKKVVDPQCGLDGLLGAPDWRSMRVSAHSVALTAPYASWRDGVMSASRRSSLARKRRALGRKGAVRFEALHDASRILEAMAAMRTWRLHRFEGDLVQQPAFYDFYVEIALRGAVCGFARTYGLWLDDQLIGALMGVCHRGRFLFLLAGMDYAAHSRQSIGALVFEDLARDCIERGDTVLDFTIGDEPYKQEFGAQPRALWMLCMPLTMAGRLAAWAVDRRAEHRGAAGTPAEVSMT